MPIGKCFFGVYALCHTVTLRETVSSARGNWQFRTLKLAVPTLGTTRVILNDVLTFADFVFLKRDSAK